jgi:hypothetical protein
MKRSSFRGFWIRWGGRAWHCFRNDDRTFCGIFVTADAIASGERSSSKPEVGKLCENCLAGGRTVRARVAAAVEQVKKLGPKGKRSR